MKKISIFLTVVMLFCVFFQYTSLEKAYAATGATLVYECEKLAVYDSSDDTIGTYNDASASGGVVLKYLSNTTGDYLSLMLNVEDAGEYSVKVRYRVYNDRPIIQHKIDGVNLGDTVDLYSSSVGYQEYELGNILFSNSGSTIITFEVVGKNASSSNYLLYPDSIELTKVEETVYECEDMTVINKSADNLSTITEGGASSGELLRFTSNEIDDYISLTMNIPDDGTYNIKVTYRVYTDRGIVQHEIDGENIGAEVDLYCSSVGYTEFDIGNFYFDSSGNKTFKIKVTGKNTSSSSYNIYPDCIVITKLDSLTKEFELMTVTDLTANTTNEVISDTNASGGALIRFLSDAIDEFISYELNIPNAGRYNIKVIYKVYSDRGIVQHKIDGVNQGSTVDLYSSSAGYQEFDLGEKIFETNGTKVLELKVTGKNASSSNYNIYPDAIILTRLTAEYECEDITVSASSGDTSGTYTDANADAGETFKYQSNSVGDYVTFTMNVPQEGTYNIKVKHRVGSDSAIVQHVIDGTDQGDEINLYSSSLGFKEVDIGNVEFSSSGNKTFKIEVAGKDSSSSNYYIYPDSITLTYVPIKVYECEDMSVVSSSGDTTGTYADGGASGGETLKYLSNAVGDYISLSMEIPEAGTYNVKVRHRLYSSRPIIQHEVDNDNVGNETDLYDTSAVYEEFELGLIHFDSVGDTAFTFQVMSQNESSTAFIIYPDCITIELMPYDIKEYSDDFSDETINGDPSHWIEENTENEWVVSTYNGNKAYYHPNESDSPMSWLHVFEKNVEFETKFLYSSYNQSNAKIRLALRCNDEDALIYAGYDFNNNKWHIKEKLSEGVDENGNDYTWNTLAESDTQYLSTSTWYHLKVIAKDNVIALYVDDMENPILITDEAEHLSPGRVALCALGAQAYFDEVKLSQPSGQGRVEDGVLEYTLIQGEDFREGATIVELNNGNLELLHRDERFVSSDDGETFSGPYSHIWPYAGHAHHNCIRLSSSGYLLKMVAEYDPSIQDPEWDSPLRFRAYVSDDDGATWDAKGLTWTSYREGLDAADYLHTDSIVMNDKLSQTSDGRVFFPVTVRKDNGTSWTGHYMEIFYIDETDLLNGDDWESSTNTTEYLSDPSLTSYAEGKVVECTDDTLRLYVPWTKAESIRYAVSSNEGVSWSGDYALESVKNAKTSFAVTEDVYADSTTYYMVWVFVDIEDNTSKEYLPRTRLGLARSYDGISWEYLMDIDRWISPRDEDNREITQMIDPSITITEDYIFVTLGRSEEYDSEYAHNAQKLRICRIEKDKLQPYAEWPYEY